MTNQTRKPARADSASEALQAALEPGETLLEYTVARYVAGFLSNQEYWIGMTERRFIFMRPNKKFQAYSIYFGFIQSVANAPLAARAKQPFLQIQLAAPGGAHEDKLNLKFVSLQAWSAFTTSMVEAYARMSAAWETRPAPPTSTQVLDQVQDLQGLGAQNAAQALLNLRMENDPTLKSEDKAQDLVYQMKTGKLAARVAAALFGIVLLWFVWMAARGLAQIGLGIVFNVIAIYNLLKYGNAAARRTALLFALLNVVLNIVISSFNGFSPLDLIFWGSFGLAMILLLVGKPNRLRVEIAGSIFAIGVIGLFAFIYFGAQYFPDAVNALLPRPSSPFVDDFSKNQNWAIISNDKVVMALENGKYAIQLKQASLIYFSFPPLTYYPKQGEVDVSLPAAYAAEPHGVYGLICRYQEDSQKYYEFLIDPIGSRYLVKRIEGDTVTPLTNPSWQKTTVLRDAVQGNRIGLACQNNQISLTVNATPLPTISDPQMAGFGDGRTGLIAMTYTDAAAPEIKVLFDNAKFWPPD